MDKLIWRFLGVILIISVMVMACDRDKPESPAPQSKVPHEMESAMDSLRESSRSAIVSGKVLESINSGDFTYMHLDRGDQKSWVALPPNLKANVGDNVSVVQSLVMPNFESRTLGRTFDELIISSGFVSGSESCCPETHEKAQTPGSPMAMGGPNQMMGSSRAAVPLQDVKVEKAQGENSYTIAELFEKKMKLKDKQIKVRGKVVKVLESIMGRNWIHLQDGTGSQEDNTHDLVITSPAVPEKDAIITLVGTLRADKDFGAGYRYSVIIEDGEITE